MNMNIILICSDQGKRLLIEEIVSLAGFILRTFPDVGSMVDEAALGLNSILLLDLDSVNLDGCSLRRLSKFIPDYKLIGISVQNYHPYLRESIQSGTFTALVKPPFEEELTYWIKSLSVSGDVAQNFSVME